jgi:RNA polymerase sigma factor (sigma-70 family)
MSHSSSAPGTLVPSWGVPFDPPAAGDADAPLVGLLRARREEALGELYDRYGGACYALARRIVGDADLAADVVQDAFLTAWREVDRFELGRGSLRTWLLTLTHHRAVDCVRRENRHRARRASVEALAATPSGEPAVDEQATDAVRATLVRQALDGLPAPQRQALLLAYFGGYTQNEIAQLTDSPLGTVKTRMLAGMRKLRAALEPTVREEA